MAHICATQWGRDSKFLQESWQCILERQILFSKLELLPLSGLSVCCRHTYTAFSMQTYSNWYLDTSWEGPLYFFPRDLTGCRGVKNYVSLVKDKFLGLYLKITFHEHFCFRSEEDPIWFFQRNYIGFIKLITFSCKPSHPVWYGNNLYCWGKRNSIKYPCILYIRKTQYFHKWTNLLQFHWLGWVGLQVETENAKSCLRKCWQTVRGNTVDDCKQPGQVKPVISPSQGWAASHRNQIFSWIILCANGNNNNKRPSLASTWHRLKVWISFQLFSGNYH